ncbi:hypothetical protein Q7P37_007001 [Cladosporium fusiforme]
MTSKSQPYHAYIFGTSFWYALRGAARLVDPVRVSGWFRPPAQAVLTPSDLEIYNIWTDGWQLITLALLLLIFSNAVPLPGSQQTAETQRARKPYAKLAILATMFHHVTTGYGAWTHWSRPTHHTKAMDIGVYGNFALTVLGAGALLWGMGDGKGRGRGKKRV